MPVITAKLDVGKIDKARLFKGEKGTYLDIVLIETPNSKYGDYMVCQSITKEERASGVRAPILGNAKVMGGESNRPRAKQAPPPQGATPDDDSSSVPF